MDDVAILSYTKMNNANIVNDSMPISGVGGYQEQSSAALLSLPVPLSCGCVPHTHVCDPHLLTLQNLMKFSMSMHFS